MNDYEIVFESDNIIYIKLSENLINEYLLMVNDIEVAKQISNKIKTYTYEQEKEWVTSKLEENAICYSMIEKKTGKYIGNIEIMNIKDNIGEIGISITPKMQNKHYGTESMKKILEYGYNNITLNGFNLNVYKTNKKAIKCYLNVGFIIKGQGKTEKDIHMIHQKV